RDQQLSARADRNVPSVDFGDAELLARSSRSSSVRRRLPRGEGPDLREAGRPRLGGRQRRRSNGARDGAPGPRAPPPVPARRVDALADGTVVERDWIVDRGAARGDVRLVPMDAVHLIGPHLVHDVMAAATVGLIAGAAPAAMTAAVDTFRGLEHAMEFVARIGG